MSEKTLVTKLLLSGLGRPTLRGIRRCPKCGMVNGTRSRSCKNKDCDVVFRGKERKKDAPLEAVQVLGLPGYDDVYFSVQCKDRGRDQRNFVHVITSPTNGLKSGFRCLLETCSKTDDSNCVHIVAAQNCSSQSEPLEIKQSVLASSISIPTRHLNTISSSLQAGKLLIQRVSKTSFVIALETYEDGPGASKSQMEMFHSTFSKPSKSETNIERIFYCSCSDLKNREEPSNSRDPFHTMCLHFYICICTFASHDKLMREFEQLIPQNSTEVSASPSLLNHLQFVNNDPNISVEIMRENLSLLEMSISASDDNTVQTLEGVLTDPIIVANVDVDDALTTFGVGDGNTLDTLDDDDHQVCHIYSNPQGTIHLSYPSQCQQLPDGTTQHIFETLPQHQEAIDNAGNQIRSKKRKSSKPISHKSGKSKIMTASRSRNPSSSIQGDPSRELSSTEDQNLRLHKGFEEWLAGVNDRINATMNYQLTTQPDSLVYYIPAAYFEYMKERLTSLASLLGGKKRLPNQTFVFQRMDSAPIGSFTKHIWKITNILHVMSVFENTMVRLRTKQYYLKSSNGNFVEWLPPAAEDEEKCQRQRILPVLHSTHLKCGKNYPSSTKESTPFIMEWVPEIFRASKLGELSIRFEFYKSEPNVELGREVS